MFYIFPTHSGTSINKLVGEGKRFIADDIVSGLKRSGKAEILKVLQQGVEKSEKLRNKRHQVFVGSTHIDSSFMIPHPGLRYDVNGIANARPIELFLSS